MPQFLDPSEIEQKAKGLLVDHNMYSVPVNPVSVAQAIGVPVYDAEFTDDHVSGMLRKEGDTYEIFVNKSHPRSRQRYTIAHEIGHFVLHRHESAIFVDFDITLYRSKSRYAETSDDEQRRETQTNIFAASLLMPEELVKQEFQKQRDMSLLAALFQVSRDAMGYRIGNLGL